MPYIKDSRRDLLASDKTKADTPGDWNYLYSLAYAKVFLSKVSYATIHALRKAVDNPHVLNEVARVEHQLAENRVTEADRAVARKLAFDEFYDRIGRLYEDKAIEGNGDIYQTVLTAVNEKYKDNVKEAKPKVLGGKTNA